MIIVARAVEIGRHHRDEIGAVLQPVGLAQFDAGDLGDRRTIDWSARPGRSAACPAASAAAPSRG